MTNEELHGSLARLYWLMGLFGITGFVSYFWMQGVQSALSFALGAAGLALRDCGLELPAEDPERMGVVMGTGLIPVEMAEVAPILANACDEFVYLKPPATTKAPARRESPRKTSGERAAREIPPIAREVVAGLLSRATGPLNPSLIKETIVRKEPDFDEREAGFSTFSRLLQEMERQGLLKRQQLNGRQWYVLPPDAAGSEKETGRGEDRNDAPSDAQRRESD